MQMSCLSLTKLCHAEHSNSPFFFDKLENNAFLLAPRHAIYIMMPTHLLHLCTIYTHIEERIIYVALVVKLVISVLVLASHLHTKSNGKYAHPESTNA